uniref:AP complex mu/sigma subunit domain-containing protein n=1 Tax=Aegilops tauschii subsp. strangulata TaxID=200361 RepID=A0A453K5Q6_AEGTS
SVRSLLAYLQIRFILLQNRQGKTRLAKYYVPLEDSEKHKVEYEVSASAGRQQGPQVH